MSKLIPLYEGILSFAGMETDANGYIYVTGTDPLKPVLVTGKRLVLPLDIHLRGGPQATETIKFHPLAEDIVKGPSEIITKLILALNIRLNVAINNLLTGLTAIAGDKEIESHLSPEQRHLLLSMPDADDNTKMKFTSFSTKHLVNDVTSFYVNIRLQRGGFHGGKKYGCVGISQFNCYEKIVDKSLDVDGVKFRESLIKLFEYVFPGIQDEEAGNYNYGSDSRVARNLDALMNTACLLVSKISDVVDLFKEHLERILPEQSMREMEFDTSWMIDFQDLEALKPELRLIPPQAGNEGSAPVPAGQPQQSSQQPQQQQQQQTTTQTAGTPGRISFKDLQNAGQSPANRFPVYGQNQQTQGAVPQIVYDVNGNAMAVVPLQMGFQPPPGPGYDQPDYGMGRGGYGGRGDRVRMTGGNGHQGSFQIRDTRRDDRRYDNRYYDDRYDPRYDNRRDHYDPRYDRLPEPPQGFVYAVDQNGAVMFDGYGRPMTVSIASIQQTQPAGLKR